MIPNRSGSAPPSIEGSFLAVNNLIYQKNCNLGNLTSSVNNSESEKQSYMSHYDSNLNSNPRLPTPPISRESRHLGLHIGRFGSNWSLSSIDDRGNSNLRMSQVTLSTHKEECEDIRSPHQPSDNLVDQKNGFWPCDDASPLVGRSRNFVDLIQDDCPRTPSPVYKLSHSISSGTTDETADHDVDSSPLHNPSVSALPSGVSNLCTDRVGLSLNADPSIAHVSSLSPLKCTGITQPITPLRKGDLSSADVIVVESDMKNLNISSLPNSKDKKFQHQWQHSYQGNMLQHQLHQQRSNSFQVQSVKSSQGVNPTYIGMDQYLHSPSKFSTEVQPVLQSSGFTPPLYASAAAYMTSPNPFYPNLQPPGLYSPQYSGGGYALNSTVVPQFVAGYPSHSAIPMVFDGPGSPNFNAPMPVASTVGGIAHGNDMQHLNKFYEQLGYPMQSSFTDPAYMQYYQHYFGPAYNVSSQLDPLASGGVIGNQGSASDTKKGSELAASWDNQKLHHQVTGVNNLYPGSGGVLASGSPSNMGVLMQYPSSPLASPVLPASPGGGTRNYGGRNEIKFPLGIGRYPVVYPGWQGQRASDNFIDPKIYNFLEELKSGKGRRFELSDISGSIVEFSADQHGSRFIQQKLENCSVEEKASVFKEVLPFAPKLMTDVFGNYVIQKFFEYGTPEQRKDLAKQLTGQILPLSLQMYGCRVIQKALDVIEPDQKAQLVRELDGHVMRCVRDQNGNHVIQKCIESVPTERIGFIISAFRSHVAELSMHPYGCRVIQRVLEHCTDELQCQFIVDEILESVCDLAQDQYGNYVTQHVLGRRNLQERCRIVNKLLGHIVQLSQHKFASNVVEKCLEYGGATERELIIEEILGQNEGNDNLLIMMKDQFANYVVQKILDICTDAQQAMFFDRVKTHMHALKKYTYGKHIVARFEQQFGEGNQTL